MMMLGLPAYLGRIAVLIVVTGFANALLILIKCPCLSLASE